MPRKPAKKKPEAAPEGVVAQVYSIYQNGDGVKFTAPAGEWEGIVTGYEFQKGELFLQVSASYDLLVRASIASRIPKQPTQQEIKGDK